MVCEKRLTAKWRASKSETTACELGRTKSLVTVNAVEGNGTEIAWSRLRYTAF